MKASRIAFRLVVFAIIAGVLWFGYTRYKAGRAQTPNYITKPAELSTIRASVSATGTLSPLVTVTVGAQVSGRIMELHADFNDKVEKGQLLARIDPSVYEAAVKESKARKTSAHAQYAQASATAELNKKQVDRIRTMVERHLMAQADLDNAKAEYKVAMAKKRAAHASENEAQAALHQAQSNLEFTYIYSPINGVILSREVDEGQSVAASFETPAIFKIAEDLSKMQVDTNVAEADIGKIHPNMTARFHVDAYPDRIYTGSVREVRLSPDEESNVVTYDAVVDVPNDDHSLLPGMTATVDFIIDKRDDVLSIPNGALRFQPPTPIDCHETDAQDTDPLVDDTISPEQPSKVVAKDDDENKAHKNDDNRSAKPPITTRKIWVLKNDEATCASVGIGITNGTRTEILSGDLHAGDAIITAIDRSGEKKKPRRGMF